MYVCISVVAVLILIALHGSQGVLEVAGFLQPAETGKRKALVSWRLSCLYWDVAAEGYVWTPLSTVCLCVIMRGLLRTEPSTHVGGYPLSLGRRCGKRVPRQCKLRARSSDARVWSKLSISIFDAIVWISFVAQETIRSEKRH